MIKKYFILIAAIAYCDGQLADYYFPQFTKASRGVVDELTKTSVVMQATQTAGDLIATGARALSFIPEVATRVLGVGNQLGLLPDISSNNLFAALDQFIPEYNAGLGNEDAVLNVRDIIRKYGYPLEEHKVTTDDGYILTMFRIPGNGSAVFLMHGLFGCADDYIVAGPENSLAYLLARDGYDVWMGNARGNKHSRRHVKMRPSEAVFWDFSWHEIGTFDLPAMIDTVLDEIGARKLKYVGHSQGTTAFFVMASERPEYNEKVALMVALSPVAYMSNVKSPVARLTAPGTPLFHELAKFVGLNELLPDNSLMRALKLVVCGTGVLADIVCSNIMFIMAGVGLAQFNFTNLPVLMGHTPAGASIKQMAHYGQGIITGDFRQFDYGSAGNLYRYGREVPPRYRLRNISAPISLFYSDADWLSHPTDVDRLYNQLDSAVDIHRIPYDQFNHLDFIWAKDFKLLVYKRLRKLLASFP